MKLCTIQICYVRAQKGNKNYCVILKNLNNIMNPFDIRFRLKYNFNCTRAEPPGNMFK